VAAAGRLVRVRVEHDDMVKDSRRRPACTGLVGGAGDTIVPRRCVVRQQIFPRSGPHRVAPVELVREAIAGTGQNRKTMSLLLLD